MASGWSPEGVYSETTSNLGISAPPPVWILFIISEQMFPSKMVLLLSNENGEEHARHTLHVL